MSNMGRLYGPPSWHHMIQAGMSEDETREMLHAIEACKNPDPEVWWQKVWKRAKEKERAEWPAPPYRPPTNRLTE